ncbi:hypothetical protein [Micromonospora citrea]|uniref:hypothetical protein n=1 Tax=Micromonospora citrea TaxID=47855 RepID=UPI001C4026CE|nr:hypothetical protein [Micromonospora citrea]
MTYYVIYRDEEKAKPAGIFVLDTASEAAVLWNHRQGSWTYNSELVARFLDDHRNLDRYENVDRSTVEGLAVLVTGRELPEEAALLSMLERGSGRTQ